MVEYEDDSWSGNNGWDYGPGNIDDYGPSADQFTVPTEENFNSYYDMANGPSQQPQQPSGWEFGPGNSEQWNNIGGPVS